MRLEGQVAIVTGGAAGIGRGIASRFAREGAQVVVADRQTPAASERADTEDDILLVPTDVSNRDEVDLLVEQVLERFGRIDILVNNAGITGANGFFCDLDFEAWQRVLSVNLGGVFHCGQAVARAMVQAQTRGRIVNVGSVNSFAAERHASAYVTAKGGVLLLTKAMAVDLAPFGITVNCLAPGPTLHEHTASLFNADTLPKNIPLGRAATVEEVASAALFLASGECGYMTGSCLLADGGQLAYLRFD